MLTWDEISSRFYNISLNSKRFLNKNHLLMNLERYSFKDFAGWSSKDDFDECLNTLEIFSCSFMLKEEMHGITFYASSISKLQENISNYLKEIYNG